MESPFTVNVAAHPKVVPLGDIGQCLVVDDFLADPEFAVALAKLSSSRFAAPTGNAYPGKVLLLESRDYIQPVADWWEGHGRHLLASSAKASRISLRYGLTTCRAASLTPAQRVCHVDRKLRESDDLGKTYAGVIYLFKNPALGGTAFFRPRNSLNTALFMKEVVGLSKEELALKYSFFSRSPQYPCDENEFFEKLGVVDAKYNRMVIYPGSIFHAPAIEDSSILDAGVRKGRLTANILIDDIF